MCVCVCVYIFPTTSFSLPGGTPVRPGYLFWCMCKLEIKETLHSTGNLWPVKTKPVDKYPSVPFHFKAHSTQFLMGFLWDGGFFSLLLYSSVAPLLFSEVTSLNKSPACEPCFRPCFWRNMSWAWPLRNETQMKSVSDRIMVSITTHVYWSPNHIRRVLKWVCCVFGLCLLYTSDAADEERLV